MGCTQSSAVALNHSIHKKHRLTENLIVKHQNNVWDDFEKIKQVGEGSISNIYLARRKNDKKSLYAVKCIDPELIEPGAMDEIKNEIELMRKIDHPNSKWFVSPAWYRIHELTSYSIQSSSYL